MLNGIYTQIDVINVQHMSMFEDVLLFSSGIRNCSLQGRAGVPQNLGSVPGLSTLHSLHFLLKLKEAIHECFSCRGAARHIDVNRDNSVAASDHGIRVVIIAPTICTASHAHHPTWLWHLIVDFSEGGGHLICESSRNNDNISLPRGGSEDNSIPVHVISRCSYVHHLHSTTCQTKCQGPEGAFPAPVNKVINPGKSPFHFVLLEVHLERRVAMTFNPVGNAGALNLVHRGHLGASRTLCVKQADG